MNPLASGRQSPSPERQTGRQQQDVPSAGKAPNEYKPKDPDNHAKRASEDEKNNMLQSNPVQHVERAIRDKYR